jgi:cold shock protein
MATGTVKWFSDDKGFGFVTEGARVEYEAQPGDKGPKATNVRTI